MLVGVGDFELVKDFFCIEFSPAAHEPGGGFGDEKEANELEDEGDESKGEHVAPLLLACIMVRDYVGDENADRNEELVQRDVGASALARRHLCDIERYGERGDADGNSCNESADNQCVKSVGPRETEDPEKEEGAFD